MRGFTLLELMVALLLSGLVISALVQTLSLIGSTLQRRDSEAELRERGRFALASLAAELQLAGNYGLGNSGGDFQWLSGGDAATALPPAALRQAAAPLAALPASAHACGINFAIDLARPIEADNNTFALGRNRQAACAPRDGARAGADTLTLRHADSEPATADAGRVQLLTSRLNEHQRWLLSDGRLPAAPALQPLLVQLHDLVVQSWYVSNNSLGLAGWPALRVKALTRVAGNATFVDSEVMPGVEDLQLRLITASGSYNPGTVPANEAVRAVQLWLLLRSARPEAGQLDAESYAYADRVLNLNAAERRFRRLLLTRTIALRNAGTG
jgi:prepilin-type N-terminal cleavage/methylation domain-containing protein